jgi:hypothetical protein
VGLLGSDLSGGKFVRDRGVWLIYVGIRTSYYNVWMREPLGVPKNKYVEIYGSHQEHQILSMCGWAGRRVWIGASESISFLVYNFTVSFDSFIERLVFDFVEVQQCRCSAHLNGS